MKHLRLFIITLVFGMFFSIKLFSTVVTSAASDDYTTWKQDDPSWNQTEAWPISEYPQAELRKMSQAGCVVTSIAMLLRHYNVVTESDVSQFNPWILNEQFKANGCFNNKADLDFSKVEKVYSTFQYAGRKSYSLEELTSLYKSGYACLVRVNGSKGFSHYVAVRSVNGSKVTVMDPGSNITSLASYKGRYEIVYFLVSNERTQNSYILTISDYNAPSLLDVGQVYSIKGTITSNEIITSVTVGIFKSNIDMLIGKTVYPNSTSYNLADIDRYIYFNNLNAGTYYYIVRASTSVGTETLLQQIFTVGGELSADWCTLTPRCAPWTRVDVSNAGTEDCVNIQIHSANETKAQDWRLVYLGNGYYAIQSRVSGKCLDVAGGENVSGTNVWQYTWNGTFAQQWSITDAGNGYYYISPRLNENLCLDVSGAGTADGTNIWVYDKNETPAQQWSIN